MPMALMVVDASDANRDMCLQALLGAGTIAACRSVVDAAIASCRSGAVEAAMKEERCSRRRRQVRSKVKEGAVKSSMFGRTHNTMKAGP